MTAAPASPAWDLDLTTLPPDGVFQALVEFGIRIGASDLFLCPGEMSVAISMRHLGVLRPVAHLPRELARRCIAHLKAVAAMDVVEQRRPQDGRLIFRQGDRKPVDLRINSLPTLHGEDISLRLLHRSSELLELAHLGMVRHDYNRLLSLLESPSGLILIGGPTGAGKTTTLYAALTYLNNGARKINTIEDPVEYALPGIRQAQVNPKLEIDFPDLLRAVLRQAPDVIMVGEIRDAVTAETAVRAANSGHLVLATVHAPVATGAVQSLLSLGVHPHFLASSLLGTVAQRLVRTLCPSCKEPFPLEGAPFTFQEVERWLEPEQGKALYGPRGCAACHQTGYRGRTGLFEVLTMNHSLRQMVLARQPTPILHTEAVACGLIPFREAALLKVAKGETSVEEVFRAVPSEYLKMESLA